jgi:hypothetical protein
MKTTRSSALAALLSLKAVAAPFLAVGDNAELFLTATVGVANDDNIFLRSAGEVSDTIFTVTPGVDFIFGRNAATSGNAYLRQEILRYSDRSALDSENLAVGINTLYTNGKSKFDFGASYVESASNDISVPGFILEKATTNLRAMGEIGATEKTSVGAGFKFEQADYKQGGGFRDNDMWEVPVDVYFEYSPKLQTSVGYRYRSTEIDRSTAAFPSSKDHFFNVGARGEFTPKLTGQIRVGYVQRKFDSGRGDKSDIGAQGDLSFAASPKTNVNLGLGSDYGSSATGEYVNTKSISIGSTTRIDEQWSWNANVAYRDLEYAARNDDFMQLGLGLAYTYNAFVNFAGSVSHRTQSSTQAASEFDNNVFNLTANIRY